MAFKLENKISLFAQVVNLIQDNHKLRYAKLAVESEGMKKVKALEPKSILFDKRLMDLIQSNASRK